MTETNPFILSVGPQNYHPNPCHGHTNIWKSLAGGLTAGRKKYVRAWSSTIGLTAFLFHADAKHRPQGAIGSDVAGVGNATTGSITDKLTREHRMTLDEAHLILNAKRGDNLEHILRVCPLLRGSSRIEWAISDDILIPSFSIRIMSTYSRQTRHQKQRRRKPDQVLGV